jgi:hypothetical protein
MLSPQMIENIELSRQVLADPATSKTITVEALGKYCDKRATVERFIQGGYLQAYQAHISVTTPYLIALEKGALKSALGVRSAKQRLFTEQYLDSSIEQTLSAMGVGVKRNQIAEIAHLYSNAKVFTVPLMLVTAVALKYKGFSTMVFTGTENVINLISKTGIQVHELASANLDRLKHTSDNWGSYYDTKPMVACIALQDVLKVIQANPKFFAMFEELSAQVAGVVAQMEAL